jgi:hypothetical protein
LKEHFDRELIQLEEWFDPIAIADYNQAFAILAPRAVVIVEPRARFR